MVWYGMAESSMLTHLQERRQIFTGVDDSDELRMLFDVHLVHQPNLWYGMVWYGIVQYSAYLFQSNLGTAR